MTNPVIRPNGTKKWFDENGKLHRGDGPAVEWSDGVKEWCKNGYMHRMDGPAYIDGYFEDWYVNGKRIDIKPILERFDISPDWRNWTDEEKFLVRLAL